MVRNAEVFRLLSRDLLATSNTVPVDKGLRHLGLSTPLSDYFTPITPRISSRAFWPSSLDNCRTYLSCLDPQEVKALSTGPSPGPQRTPFLVPQRALLLTSNPASLKYFSIWGIHTKSDPIACADNCDNHTSTKIPPKSQKPYICHIDSDKPSLFSGLHCALSLGLLRL